MTSWKNLHICKTGHSNGGERAVISSWRITPCIHRLPSTWLSTSSQTFLVTRAQICGHVTLVEHEQIILSMLSLDRQYWTNVLHSSQRPELIPWPGCLGAMGQYPLGQISSESHDDLALGLSLYIVVHKLVAGVEVDNLLQAWYLDARLQHISYTIKMSTLQ